MLVLLVSNYADAQSSFTTCYHESYPFPSVCAISDFAPISTSPDTLVTFAGDNTSEYRTVGFGENSQVGIVPRAIFSMFPEMSAFHAYDAGITSIVTDNFVNCSRLLLISLQDNPFTELPSGFASTCLHLLTITSSGSLETLHVDSLKGLTRLVYLILNHNRISCLPLGLFDNTPNLREAVFADNLISTLDPNLFFQAPMLYIMGLNNNSISTIPNLKFNRTHLTVILYLQENPITSIDPEFFDSFVSYFHILNSTHPATIDFSDAKPGSCIPSDNSVVTTDNYAQVNSAYSTCRNNWVGNAAVPCDAVATTTTTLPPTSTEFPCKPENFRKRSDFVLCVVRFRKLQKKN